MLDVDERHDHLIFVVGDAGVGKSEAVRTLNGHVVLLFEIHEGLGPTLPPYSADCLHLILMDTSEREAALRRAPGAFVIAIDRHPRWIIAAPGVHWVVHNTGTIASLRDSFQCLFDRHCREVYLLRCIERFSLQ